LAFDVEKIGSYGTRCERYWFNSNGDF